MRMTRFLHVDSSHTHTPLHTSRNTHTLISVRSGVRTTHWGSLLTTNCCPEPSATPVRWGLTLEGFRAQTVVQIAEVKINCCGYVSHPQSHQKSNSLHQSEQNATSWKYLTTDIVRLIVIAYCNYKPAGKPTIHTEEKLLKLWQSIFLFWWLMILPHTWVKFPAWLRLWPADCEGQHVCVSIASSFSGDHWRANVTITDMTSRLAECVSWIVCRT